MAGDLPLSLVADASVWQPIEPPPYGALLPALYDPDLGEPRQIWVAIGVRGRLQAIVTEHANRLGSAVFTVHVHVEHRHRRHHAWQRRMIGYADTAGLRALTTVPARPVTWIPDWHCHLVRSGAVMEAAAVLMGKRHASDDEGPPDDE